MKETKTIKAGNVLRNLRTKRKLSQEETAYRAKLDRTFISMLERDIKQPTLTTIFSLAKAFEMKPSELVREIENDDEIKLCIDEDTDY